MVKKYYNFSGKADNSEICYLVKVFYLLMKNKRENNFRANAELCSVLSFTYVL